MLKSIAVMTSGGDSPGMNAAARAVVRTALFEGAKVWGINNGYHGLLEEDMFEMQSKNVGDIIQRGGTFLGTARCRRWQTPEGRMQGFQNLYDRGIQGLIVIGGDGSLRGAELLSKETGMPIVTEIMDASHIDLFEDVDIIQVGARNMQNFELLKELGKLDKPIFLKRGLSSTYQELLMSAEYIMANGNEKVILCERGIRTFETATRNTLDLAAVPMLKEKTHLPVIIDPSHASGIARLVKPMSFAAAACGADGLMIEVHNDPAKALCDGPQALRPEEFCEVVKGVEKIRNAIGV